MIRCLAACGETVLLRAGLQGLDGLRESILARTREAAGFAIALVVRSEPSLVIERESLLATRVEHKIRERWTDTLHLRVVVLLVEAGHRIADLGDRARGRVVAERGESGAVLLLRGATQTCHGKSTSAGLWPQARPVGMRERLKKNDLSFGQIVFLQSRTFARCVIQNETICRWHKEGNA